MIIQPNKESLLNEFRNGKKTAWHCGIEQINSVFAWMPGFQYCITGTPGSGKSTMAMFLAVAAAKQDRSVLIFTPEMLSNHKGNIDANDVFDELVFMLTGKSPYKHFEDVYKIPQMTENEYLEALDQISKNITVFKPKRKTPADVLIEICEIFDDRHYDIVFIDTFKDMSHEIGDRSDLYLDQVFGTYEEKINELDYCHVWIAHPKSNLDLRDKKTGLLRYVDAYDINGGSSWFNNMDCIISINRPAALLDKHDNQVVWVTQKFRKQALTRRPGESKCVFDWRTNRYYWDGVCPLGNSIYVKPKENPLTLPHYYCSDDNSDRIELSNEIAAGKKITNEVPF